MNRLDRILMQKCYFKRISSLEMLGLLRDVL